MAKSKQINLSQWELAYLIRLYNLQRAGKNGVRGVTPDMLPYTPQIDWIVTEMEKKFPRNGFWNENEGRRLIHRTLTQARKNSMLDATERNSKTKLVLPDFESDTDASEMEDIIEVGANGPTEPAEPTEDGQ